MSNPQVYALPRECAPTVSRSRELTELEQAVLLQKNNELLARRAADRDMRRSLNEHVPKPSFSPPSFSLLGKPSESVPTPPPPDVLKASYEAVPVKPTAFSLRRVERARPAAPAPLPGPDPADLAREAVEAAAPILEAHVRPRARKRAALVYGALVEAAYTLVRFLGHSRHVTTYTFFTVLDTLQTTGLGHSTCERALADLRDCKLIRTSRWYTKGRFLDKETGELQEQACCGGVWLAIVLRPAPGRWAQLYLDELPEEAPRDLDGDRQAGRTGHRLVQETRKSAQARKTEVGESIPRGSRKETIKGLLQWSLPSVNSPTCVERDSPTSAPTSDASPPEVVWALTALVSAPSKKRGERIAETAKALMRVFRDERSFEHYCRLLHRAVAAEARGLPALAQLQHAMTRVLVDMRELGLHRPGGRLVQLLKACEWWEGVYRAA